MKKYIIILISCLLFSIDLQAQSEKVEVSGIVTDAKGVTLPGVSIFIKNMPGVGVASDIDGQFKLSVVKYQTLVFTFIGCKTKEYVVGKEVKNLKIKLEDSQEQLEEVVVVGQGEQRRVSVTGAISTIDPEALAVPANSVSNMLGGRVPGIIARTMSGEPGDDNSEFWIRGVSTFGANASALVLIDGVDGNIDDVDASDIESFSVLKDASATAVYGNRGANGVVLITTKKGKAGKLSVNYKSSVTYSYSPRMPEYLGAYEYAKLANEARTIRDLPEIYTDVELGIIENKLDPDLYPNVNWQEEILKKSTAYHQHYVSFSGGSDVARYFASFGYQNKAGIFKEENMHNYNTNINYQKYTFRVNVAMDLTKTTSLSLGLDGTIDKKNSPGYGGDNQAIWAAQVGMTPIAVPVRYSNGMLPAYGDQGNELSPYVILNHTGFKTNSDNTTRINFGLNQDLSAIVKGLKVSGMFNFNSTSVHSVSRDKMPELFRALDRGNNGELIMQKTVSQKSLQFTQKSNQTKQYYFQTNLNYSGVFDKHRVTGMLHFYMEDNQDTNLEGVIASIPKKYLGLSGRATYSYDDTYLLEANFGYTGSENFKVGEQYGFFPAFSAGWMPSSYEWFQDHLSTISYLKIRGSYGQVGNDKISDTRFPYFTYINWDDDVAGNWGGSAITEGQIGASNLQWETAHKYNFGVDIKLFADNLSATVDVFKDVRDGIFQSRYSMPGEVGAITKPYVNIGQMESGGVDGNIEYKQRINANSDITVRANMTYAKNEIKNYEEPLQIYPYKYKKGLPSGAQRGLVSLGLFKDSTEILSSPKQTFGEVRPGDIRYKDVTGDGKIDSDDEVPLSYNSVPQLQYGFAADYAYKNWRFSIWFKGVSKTTFFKGGMGYYPFRSGEIGNVLTEVLDGGHWTPSWYSGDPSTENPNAMFPRLTYGNSDNNNRASSFYLANGKYLKLQNITVSYNYKAQWMRTIGVKYMNLQLIGDNLACWDEVEIFDPEQASDNGAVYPLQRKFSFQLNITF